MVKKVGKKLQNAQKSWKKVTKSWKKVTKISQNPSIYSRFGLP